jgi:hypothetical protein
VSERKARTPAAPARLSAASKALWRSALAQREFSSAELALLAAMLGALDRADAASKIVDRDGLIVESRGALKAHPAIDIELRERGLVARLVRQLGLQLEEDEGELNPRVRQAKHAANARWGRVARIEDARRARGAS